MKKVLALIFTRHKPSNTVFLANKIIEAFKNSFSDLESEVKTPDEINLLPCIGCNNCFVNGYCILNDQIKVLQKKIDEADILIIGSPVYLHDVTSDTTIFFNRLAYWNHTLRMNGKNTIVISTCDSNGHQTVTNNLEEKMNLLGANVFCKLNAAESFPKQLFNQEWMNQVCQRIIALTVLQYNQPHANETTEKSFQLLKRLNKFRLEANDTSFEPTYWQKNLMQYDNFADYLIKLKNN